jgi:tetratricopeptide (TPR) repeat protein
MQHELEEAARHRRAGRYDEARQILNALEAQYPQSGTVQYHLAWLHDSMGEESGAVPYYEKAVKLGIPDEDLRGVLLGLGSTYRTLGRYQEAAETLRKGIETFPDAPEFPVFYAMALYNVGQGKEAVQLLLKTLVTLSGEALAEVQGFEGAISIYAEDLDRTWI